MKELKGQGEAATIKVQYWEATTNWKPMKDDETKAGDPELYYKAPHRQEARSLEEMDSNTWSSFCFKMNFKREKGRGVQRQRWLDRNDKKKVRLWVKDFQENAEDSD